MQPSPGPEKHASRGGRWRVLLGCLLLFGGLGWPWVKSRHESSSLQARPIASDASSSEGEGEWVAVTGPLRGAEPIGDPLFLEPGPELNISRTVEMYGWVESRETQYGPKPGAKGVPRSERYIYSYKLEWTETPELSVSFHERSGHENPPAPPRASFQASKATIGAFEFSPDFTRTFVHALNPEPERLRVSGPEGSSGRPRLVQSSEFGSVRHGSGVYVFQGKGTPQQPEVGDLRVSFSAVPPIEQATLVARRQGRTLLCGLAETEMNTCQLFEGDWARAENSARGDARYQNRTQRRASLGLIGLGLALAFGPVLGRRGASSRPWGMRALQVVLVLCTGAVVLWAATQAGAAMAHGQTLRAAVSSLSG